MSVSLKELSAKRFKLIKDAREGLDAATASGEPLTNEQRGKFDAMLDEAGTIKDQIGGLQKDIDRMAVLEAAERSMATLPATPPAGPGPGIAAPPKPETRTIELRDSVSGYPRSIVLPDGARSDLSMVAWNDYLLSGPHPEAQAARREFRAAHIEELRALQKDSDTVGGFLSPPIQWLGQLIQALDNLTFMRQICNVLPPLTVAQTLGTPSLDTDISDPTWVAEIAIGTEDSSLAFGKRELNPHPLAQFIKVSNTLLRRSQISADGIVRERLAFKNAAVMENAFLNGTGAMSPLGVFTASDEGISTSRDVSTGNTSTEIRFDGLQEAKYNQAAQYRAKNTGWIFHRDGVKQIAKLKDGEGRYIWQASVLPDRPDMILGYPVFESEYAPNTFTASLYVGIIGDFSQYWIVDALTATVQVLVELYAGTNQSGFLSRLESDGMPILEAAFTRVKLGA